ncbi:MAG: 16S rRNA (cytosine(967)-C(5))-methyltransferase [Cyanobacteriota bacterium]
MSPSLPATVARSSSQAAGDGQGLAARRVAWAVLQAVAAGAYADGALERELQRQSLGPLDRSLATELSYGAIRQRHHLDGWLDWLGRVPAKRQPPALRWLLHLGLYQLLFTARVPAPAAVSTTVELAKRGGLPRLAPVVNGLLRQALRRIEAGEGLPLPEDPAAALALGQSLPPWLATELLRWRTPVQAEAFGRAANTPPVLDLRVNALRSDPAAVQQALAAVGVQAERLRDQPWGLTLTGRSGDLRLLPGYEEGHWCVQDRSAQLIAPLLAARPGEKVLDACAAPGGKATQLAESMGDTGEIWAVDRGAARLQRLERNARRLGLTSIRSRVADAVQLAAEEPAWIGFFDRVLLDAPCSGLGTLARHADARWRINPGAIEELIALQGALLRGVAPLLKPSGRLVYATCTVHPSENRALIEAFLAEHPGWRTVPVPRVPASGPESSPWLELWPGENGGGDGFFAAVLEAPTA